MNSIFDFFNKAEEHFEEFVQWQIDHYPTDNFFEYARNVCKPEDIFAYASLLYPMFIKVEGAILLKDHYDAENWERWRSKYTPKDAARVINHIHIGDLLFHGHSASKDLEYHIGKLFALFWKIAVDHQFPENNVNIEFTGDVIEIYEN